ncbi:response regulator transcription factor [Ruminiclostridium cellobioparum]|uniref:Stage 0 sporulation protein A homolog n=1 Tax=Ruminiclostridium cellobioparum subsp. termitidis CT1112 TaxID=1195236 RepID=S0FUH5_RUMCE|nr:response regulator [Ruminiclostridium cellobioparum]EMS73971.1 two component AraC family transcriptional regulatory protein [Ruminiclostridium cellobioparum subsp. termitidis CT1112]
MFNILIVDDEEIIRKGLTKLIELSNSNFRVAGEASDGKKGLELAIKLNPDVVIVDVEMPLMNGLEMIDMIMKTESGTKFIVLSAHTDYRYTRHAIKSGVVDYLMKPVNRFELSDLLKSIEKDIESEKSCRDTASRQKDEGAGGGEEPRSERKTIEAAKEYINKNFFNSISLESVARHVHMNTNYFSSLFKKETGENFIDYLTKVRVEKAKTLLANPNLKIHEICQIVGYYSTKHFARLFKEMVGMTPSEYRANIK